jgi:hypothetical protein
MSTPGEQTKREIGSAAIVRLLLALSVGLLLGFLGSHLFGQRDWSRPLFLLLAPLLLGMTGMLTVRTRKERLIKSGFSTGWLLWFGVWVAVLLWKWFQPETITNCSFPDGPCASTILSFGNAYAGSGFLVFVVFLAWGLALVVIGAALMESVMTSAQRRGNKPKAS